MDSEAPVDPAVQNEIFVVIQVVILKKITGKKFK